MNLYDIQAQARPNSHRWLLIAPLLLVAMALVLHSSRPALAVSPPVVSSLSPATGPAAGGTTVGITGSGFTGASSVKFGANAAPGYVVDNDSHITALSAAGSLGVVNVTVTTPGGTSAAAAGNQFTYAIPAPVIGSVSPPVGPITGGTSVIISGSGLTGTSAVTFGGTTTFVVNNDGQITATTPAHALGAVSVVVTAPGGTASGGFTYQPTAPPVLTNLGPNSGPTAGGTTVMITGSGFTGASAVTFGGVGIPFAINNDGLITVSSPPQVAGPVTVAVSNAAGTSNGLTYTYINPASPPIVSGLNPGTGTTAGGTPVIITGAGFTGVSAVMFGGTAAASFTFNSATQITATSPAGTGSVNVLVTTPNGTSAPVAASLYTYGTIGVPSIGSLSPPTGLATGGTSVTITGSNFIGASSVMFGGAAATAFTVNSATQITATSPAGAAGGVLVTVTTPGGTSVGSTFSYVTSLALPVILSIAPPNGPTTGGTGVTITGTGFTNASAVTFGAAGAATTFTVNNDASITATSPAAVAGPVYITVTTPAGTSAITANGYFTFGATAGTPVIYTLSPATGPIGGGTTVIISGAGFTGATSVLFGSTPAVFTINSDAQITATSPVAAAAGAVNVTVTNGSGTSGAALFTYTTAAGAPVVSGLSPATGPTGGGTSVIIYGSGFTGTTSVLFGTSSASFTFNSDTQITATSPAGSAGVVTVTVTNAGGSSASSSAANFTYTATAALPVVTALSPASGPTAGGTRVTISGTGFTGASSVRFGGVAATYTVNNDSQITATTPSGSAGSVYAVVTTAGGSSAANAASSFTYTASSNLCPLIPLWVDDLLYGSPGGGFYWDGGVSGEVWTPARGWHYFSPQPPRPSPRPLWVDALTYGSIGGGFWWDPVSDQVWTGERGWHQYAPTGCTPR